LGKEDLEDELEALLVEAELDEEQECRVQTQFAKQYHLITREDRLEKIAADLVQEFAGRGYRGKAMFIAIDKATAVRMFDKVKAHWSRLVAEEEDRLANAPPEIRDTIAERLSWMHETDMAVVV